jgi:hypothetical protein
MSHVKRAREEAVAPGAGAAAAAAAPAISSLSLDDTLLVLGIVAQTLARRMHTVGADVEEARAVFAAWSARAPRPGDDEGCQARARRAAELAVKHAEDNAEEAPKLLYNSSTHVTGLCRDTWRFVPPGLNAAEAVRVRAEHPIWRAVIDVRGRYERTRLMWAASEGKLEQVRSLCDWRASLEMRNSYGLTVLHWACTFGRKDCARELIARGADVNAATTYGYTPLMNACSCGRIDTVRLLLAAGAVTRRATNSGQTAHSLASCLPSARCLMPLREQPLAHSAKA